MDTILCKISLNTYTLSISVLTRFSQAIVFDMIVELPYWFQTGFTTLQGSCGKVILSVVSVCLSVYRGRVPCYHYLWCIGLHGTSLPVIRGIIFHSWNGTSSVFHKVQRLNVLGMEFLVSRNTSESKNRRYVMTFVVVGLYTVNWIKWMFSDLSRWWGQS